MCHIASSGLKYVVNNDNKKIAQAILDSKKHPDFGMAERIESFKE